MTWLAPALSALLAAGPVAPSAPPLPPSVTAPQDANSIDGWSTEVHFLGYRGDETYVVTVADQSCTTPCTLMIHPGPTKVHVVGSGETDLQMVIPHLTAQVRLNTGAPSWYQPAGIALIPTGIVVASSLWALGLTCSFNSGACFAVNAITWPVLGASMLIVGSVLLGLYNRSQPADANRAEILDASRTTGWHFEGFSLAPTRNGVTGGFTLTF